MNLTITPASTVTLHFSIKLPDGSTAENTRQYKKPAQFTMGDGSLSEKFESLLLGLSKGDKRKFKLEPEDAFGMPEAANIYELARNTFPDDITLEEGLIIAFQQPNGTEMPGIIRRFDANHVTVDFNHPLAGQALIFDVEILDVQ